eukprot:PhF_6_TR23748/c1_g4_i3/m.33178
MKMFLKSKTKVAERKNKFDVNCEFTENWGFLLFILLQRVNNGVWVLYRQHCCVDFLRSFFAFQIVCVFQTKKERNETRGKSRETKKQMMKIPKSKTNNKW